MFPRVLPGNFGTRRASIVRGTLLLGVLLVSVYVLVYSAGGMWLAWGQLFYVPIILAGLEYGHVVAVVVAITAGFLAGPAMPQSVVLGQARSVANWLYRMALFVTISLAISVPIDVLRRQRSTLEAQEQVLREKTAALTRSIEQTMRALVACIEPHLGDSGDHHSLRAARLSVAIGKALGLSAETLPDLWWAGFVHDIGKVGVPQRLLEEPGLLTAEEVGIIRRHPVTGRDLLRAIPATDAIRDAVEFHHERWDGTGYPDGRKGQQIPLAARIVAVADCYDHAGLDAVRRGAGSAFDPQVVDALAQCLRSVPRPDEVDALSSDLTKRVAEFVSQEARSRSQAAAAATVEGGATRRHAIQRVRAALRLTTVAAGLVLSAVVIYVAGGTAYAWGHLFYIPMIAASLWFGPAGGAGAGLAAGLLEGPWMPLDASAGLMQPTASWVFRTVFFATVGGVMGTLYHAVRRDSRRAASGIAQLNVLAEYLENLAETVIRTMARTIESADRYTRYHSERVSEYAVSIARRLGLDEDRATILKWAGIVHDLGKVGVAGHVLAKPGPLTLDERDHIRTHVDLSRRIIEQVDMLAPAVPAVWTHHERCDGSGYPRGLRGSDIPLEGRILAVADVYEALTSDRPYRQAWPRLEALRHLEKNAGSLFDPAVVRAFVDEFGEGGVQVQGRETLLTGCEQSARQEGGQTGG